MARTKSPKLLNTTNAACEQARTTLAEILAHLHLKYEAERYHPAIPVIHKIITDINLQREFQEILHKLPKNKTYRVTRTETESFTIIAPTKEAALARAHLHHGHCTFQTVTAKQQRKTK